MKYVLAFFGIILIGGAKNNRMSDSGHKDVKLLNILFIELLY